MLGPRKERYSWDDAFMSMAIQIAQRSPDPSTQVGAIIVDSQHRVIGAGYNGPPRGLHPNCMPWDREGEPGKTKYDYVLHAEYNAIHNSTASTKGATLYVTLQSCNSCAAGIVQAGITKVVYLDDKYKDLWFTKLGAEILDQTDIKVRQHKWSKSFLNIIKNLKI